MSRSPSLPSVPLAALPSLHGVRPRDVPPLPRYYEELRLPTVLPALLRFLRSAVPARCLETDRISQVPGEPQCERAPVYDPGGTSAPGIAALRCGLPCGKRRRLPRRVPFRGSITRPTHSLCTLRSRGRPPNHATLGSGRLPAFAGQECYLLGSIERFQLHLILLSQALPGALSAGTSANATALQRRTQRLHALIGPKIPGRLRNRICREGTPRTLVGVTQPRSSLLG
jgi:hypothetical protein